MPTTTLNILQTDGSTLYSAKISFNDGDNVQNILEKAANTAESTSIFTFGAQYYGTYQSSPLGYLVNMFNSIYDSPESHNYWDFSYNGSQATQGIDYVLPADDSTIAFQQQHYEEKLHEGTVLEHKHRHHLARY